MKHLLISGSLALALLTVGLVAEAADVSGGVGSTSDGNMVFRVSSQSGFADSWLQSSTGELSGYWDGGYTYWESGNGSSTNHSVSLSPVFVYQFSGQSVRPIIEAGIGVALFSNTQVDGNKMGSAFQFEDRLGFGLRFAGQEVGMRVIHYSNAGLSSPNQGVESYGMYYRATL